MLGVSIGDLGIRFCFAVGVVSVEEALVDSKHTVWAFLDCIRCFSFAFCFGAIAGEVVARGGFVIERKSCHAVPFVLVARSCVAFT